MKNLFLLFCLAQFSASAQVLFEKSWSSDFKFVVADVAVDEQGNAYFACSGYNTDIDSSVSVVVKTNADYNILWSNSYRTYRRDDLGSIELLSDGNLLLGGTMRQDFAFDQGGGLIKIDPDGNVIWRKVILGAYDERVIHTSELLSGEIVSVVRYGVSNQASSVVTTDASGEILDRYRTFQNTEGVLIEDVSSSTEGTFFATGAVFDGTLGRNLLFIVAFTNTEILWSKNYDLGESSRGLSIDVNSDGELAVGGIRVDPESVFNGSNGIFLVLDNLGEVIFSNRIFREDNGFSEFVSGVDWQENGNLLVSMNFQTDVGNLPLQSEFDSEGMLNWSIAIENGESTSSVYAASISDNRLLTAGRNFNGHIILNTFIAGELVACNEAPAEFDLEALSVEDLDGNLTFVPESAESTELPIEVTPWPMEENETCTLIASTENWQADLGVSIYPNPAQDIISMDIPAGVQFLRMLNSEGKLLYTQKLKMGITDFSLDSFRQGLYLFQFWGDNGYQTHRLIVK